MRERFLVKITRQAEIDLDEIWAYIAADNVDNANRFVLKLEGANKDTCLVTASLSVNSRK